MVSIRGYLSANFTKSFLTVFLPFFLIISLIYLVKISMLTSKIQISFLELIELYSYYVPAITFYSLPISFVAALVTTLLRLSVDNELIALFSLGLKPDKLMKALLGIAALFSLLLLIISLAAIPQAIQLHSAFKHVKKEEMNFNVIPEEFGQKFGNAYIFIRAGDPKTNHLQDVVIYSRDKKQNDQITIAKQGMLHNNQGTFSLELEDGKGYLFASDKLEEIRYAKSIVYDTVSRTAYESEDLISYWKRALTDQERRMKLYVSIFISLIPLLCLYLVSAFTIINPRYQANHTFLVIGGVVAYFYLIASGLQRFGTLWGLVLVTLITAALGIWTYRRNIVRFF
jgi:lipopolysaccharide export system permease protein